MKQWGWSAQQLNEMAQRNFYQQLAKYSSVIFILPASCLVGYVIGNWLDGYFGTTPALTVTMILVGAAAGFWEIFRLLGNQK